MDEHEYKVFYGGEVKALGDGRIGGYLVRFSAEDAPDLEGDYFDAETDFGEAKASPVYYQHGLDAHLKTRKLGRAELKTDEFGVWAEFQMEMRDQYEQYIYEMTTAGKMGWSSGTAAHLVEREQKGGAFHVKHWPLGLDASLTPTPAEPRNEAVPLKSLKPSEAVTAEASERSDQDDDAPNANEAQKSTAASEQPIIEFVTQTQEDIEMSEKIETPEPANDEVKRAEVDALSDKLDAVLKAIQESPKLERGGYMTNDGGDKDASHKSFGDWLLAVKRNDTKRLASVYAQKDLGKDTGSAGGYMVPEEFANSLLQIAEQASPLYQRVNKVPVNVNSGSFPALDYSVSPTAGSGQTALAAGNTAATKEENAALAEDEPVFRELNWKLNKIGGITQASNELISDSPQAIESLLSSLFGITISNKNERNIIRGSGAGEPVGILNAACTVAVTTASDNAFAEADALAMLSRFKRLSGQQPVWVMHPGVIPDLNSFSSASSVDMVTWGSGQAGLSSTLLGYPIIFSEHMPQDDYDDVILADLGSYLWFEKGGLMIDYSEHYAFNADQGTWRYTQRNDGMPWLNAAITLADPQGSFTVSPFVYHND